MSKLIDNIRRLAAIIKNENRSGANTAARIGGLFEEIAGELEMKLDKTGNGQDVAATFSPSANRDNIASGEKLSILFGKIAKWFSDLKAVAFTGKASDLEQDAAHRLVTDLQTAAWSDKYTRAETDTRDTAALQAAKEYAAAKIAEIVNSSPSTLDTLQELAAALGNDPNFATSIMALVGGKADTVHAHTTSQITDFPTSLPAAGGNADSSNILLLTQDRPTYGNGMIINQHSDFKDAPELDKWFNYMRILHGNQVGFFSEIATPFTDSQRMYFRNMIGGVVHPWNAVAYLTDIPTSLPANGGNADTVSGYAINALLKHIGYALDMDTIIGNVVAAWTEKSIGTPSQYGSLIQWGNNADATPGENWINQLAGTTGGRLMFRTRTNNADWLAWETIARLTDIPASLPANGGNADTLDGHRYNQFIHVVANNSIQADNTDGSFCGFGYAANGFPTDGSFISFGGLGNEGKYITQIQAGYVNGNEIYFRTRIDDTTPGINHPWRRIALSDEIPNSDLGGIGSDAANWDTFTTPGANWTNSMGWGTNAPNAPNMNGLLIVSRSGNCIVQCYEPSDATGAFKRVKPIDGYWSDWKQCAMKADIPATTAQLTEVANKKFVTDAEKTKIDNSLEVICAGVIDANGGVQKKRGNFITVRINPGRIAIDHDFGTTDYIVTTMDSTGKTSNIDTPTSASFIINIVSPATNTRFVMYKI